MSLLVVKFLVFVALRFVSSGRRPNWRRAMRGDMAIPNSVFAPRRPSCRSCMAVLLRH